MHDLSVASKCFRGDLGVIWACFGRVVWDCEKIRKISYEDIQA